MKPLKLTFQVLDDLSLGVERGLVTPEILSSLEIASLSPVIEAWHQSHLFKSNGISLSWLYSPLTSRLLGDFFAFRSSSQLNGSKIGWIVGKKLFDREQVWFGFIMRAKKAASNVGFDRRTVNGITGALEEFRSNISEHSENPESGYAAFLGGEGTFEFVVGDAGVGVLNSLKRKEEYSNLSDHGEALRLALTEGITRHNDVGRGNGFRPLLVGLANIAGHVRFRSGDNSYEINKVSNEEIRTNINQKLYMRGFSCATSFSLRLD